MDRETIDILARATQAEASIHEQSDLFYSNFIELFVESMQDYMEITATHSELPDMKEFDEFQQDLFIATQRVYGDIDLIACVAGDAEACLKFAEIFSEEKFDEVDDMVADSVMEFLNVVNGIYSVQLASRKINTELAAPQWKKISDLSPADKKVYKISSAEIKDFYVVISDVEIIEG